MNDIRRPRPPIPDARRGTAKGVGEAVEKTLPVEDHGLGPVGEKTLIDLLEEADREEASHRTLVKFGPRWREFIRRQDETRLDAADEVIDDYLERKALKRIWKRVWQWSLVVVPIVYGWASGFFANVWPVLQRILKAIQAPPT